LATRTNPTDYKIACGFGDSADPGAIETLSRALCPTYGNADAKDVIRGLQEVKKFLSVYNGPDGEKKSHLYVHKSCVNTIFEFQNYRIKTSRSEENTKEDPRKWADHSMDAVRYGIMHLYVLGARYHLEDVMVASMPARDGLTPMDYEPEPVGAGRVLGDPGGIFSRNEDSVFHLDDVPRW